jgi:hypothetical protein
MKGSAAAMLRANVGVFIGVLFELSPSWSHRWAMVKPLQQTVTFSISTFN